MEEGFRIVTYKPLQEVVEEATVVRNSAIYRSPELYDSVGELPREMLSSFSEK